MAPLEIRRARARACPCKRSQRLTKWLRFLQRLHWRALCCLGSGPTAQSPDAYKEERMSRRVTCGIALALALLGGCAAADGENGAIDEESGDAGEEESAAETEGSDLAESQQALTVPSFALISQQSGKALTGGSLSNGSLVTQTRLLQPKGAPNQRWVSINQNITPESQPNLCLEAGSSNSGAQIRLRPCTGGPLQGWRLELKLQNGIKLTRWKNLPSGLYLDTAGSTSEGSAMVVRPFNGTTTQLFSRLF
jgi:hypothetical protein